MSFTSTTGGGQAVAGPAADVCCDEDAADKLSPTVGGSSIPSVTDLDGGGATLSNVDDDAAADD